MSGNLAALVRRQAHHQPDHPALEHDGTVIDYAAAWQRIESLAGWLDTQGITVGSRVALALPETTDHVLLHFAIAAAGAVLVPIDHRSTTTEQDALAAAFGAQHILSHCHDAGRIAVPEAMPDTAAPSLAPGGHADWLISLSSGSTGQPKGALVTHEQMRERFVTQWRSLGLCGADRFALATPLCFGAGRSFAMSTLAAGGTLILLPPPMSPVALAQAIRDASATATFLVPTQLRRFTPRADGQPLFPGLRRLVVSGEPLPAAEALVFRETLSAALIGYYASSEGGGISVLAPEAFATHPDSVGLPAYGVDVELVDDADQPVASGAVGRLRYRGPGVTQRSIDDAGRPVAAGNDWFYPGDLARCDANGYLYLAGRSKDVIVRAGVNVYPTELERTIGMLPGVEAVAVIGVPSEDRGETIHAFVVGDVDETELQAHCRSHLAPYKQPEVWHGIGVLPRTTADKIDKQALRQRASGHGGSPQ